MIYLYDKSLCDIEIHSEIPTSDTWFVLKMN